MTEAARGILGKVPSFLKRHIQEEVVSSDGVIMSECDAWSSGSHVMIMREAGPLRAAWKVDETWASVDVTAALSQLALGCCTFGLFLCRRRISLLFKPFAVGSSVPCSCKHSK